MSRQDCGNRTPHPLLPIHGGETGMCLTRSELFTAIRPQQPVERFSSTPIMDRGILLWAKWQLGLDSMLRPGRAEWIQKKNCSTHLTGSCTKTSPILSASPVRDEKSC